MSVKALDDLARRGLEVFARQRASAGIAPSRREAVRDDVT
jgi:hypothetical protein